MHLNKQMRHCVDFANFSKNNKIPAYDLAVLITIAKLAINANLKDKDSSAVRKRFEREAKKHGFKVEWNSYAPTLTKHGRDIYLPIGV